MYHVRVGKIMGTYIGAAPKTQTGGRILLEEIIANDDATIAFSESNITATYGTYEIDLINITPATDQQRFQFQVNAVGASGYNETFQTHPAYAEHVNDDATNTVVSMDGTTNFAQENGTAEQFLTAEVGNGAAESLCGNMIFYEPADTTFVTMFRAFITAYQYADASYTHYTGGYIHNSGSTTAFAVDDIRFSFPSGNIATGKFRLYGVDYG